MKIIEVKDLYKIYKDDGVETVALQDINLSIDEGEFVAIMGPSGSGKSTLLHVLGFLDRPTRGSYLFKGKNIDDYTDEEAARIRNKEMGFVFQMFNLLPKTTVLDNVKLPLLYSNVPASEWDKLARAAVESVGMTYRLHHEPSQLSGGEKQKVAIARALVLSPSIIFADEPTGNLDSKSGQVIMKVLQDLHEKHSNTIVLITHETFTAEHAERIIKLHDGRVVSDQKIKTRRRAETFIK